MRIVAGMLLAAFLTQDAAWAIADRVSAGSSAGPNPFSIGIPESLGRVDSTRRAGQKLIIHIRDAHTNPGAQRNIAKILESLRETQGIQTVYLEGGTQDDSLGFLAERAPALVRERVANQYLLAGELSGAEYLNVTAQPDWKLLGVEDPKLYDRNLKRYAEVVALREKAISDLSRIQITTASLKRKFYPKNVLPFDEAFQAFRSKDKSFSDYFIKIQEAAGVYRLNLLGYPHLLLLGRLREKEEGIDFTQARKELAAALSQIPDGHQAAQPPAELKRGSAVELQFFESILESSPGSLPSLQAYVEYLREFSKLDLEKVLSESEAFESEWMRAALDSPEAKYLHEADRHLSRLQDLFQMQISREDFEKLQAESKDIRFRTVSILAFLNRLLLDSGRYESALEYKPEMDQIKEPAQAFYRENDLRDEAMVRKTLEWMEKSGQKAGVLIAGGFHTENLKRLLAEKGCSYAVISPNIENETNQARYENVLLGELVEKPSSEFDAPRSAITPKAFIERSTFPAFVKELDTLPAGARLGSSAKKIPLSVAAKHLENELIKSGIRVVGKPEKMEGVEEYLIRAVSVTGRSLLFIISIPSPASISLNACTLGQKCWELYKPAWLKRTLNFFPAALGFSSIKVDESSEPTKALRILKNTFSVVTTSSCQGACHLAPSLAVRFGEKLAENKLRIHDLSKTPHLFRVDLKANSLQSETAFVLAHIPGKPLNFHPNTLNKFGLNGARLASEPHTTLFNHGPHSPWSRRLWMTAAAGVPLLLAGNQYRLWQRRQDLLRIAESADPAMLLEALTKDLQENDGYEHAESIGQMVGEFIENRMLNLEDVELGPHAGIASTRLNAKSARPFLRLDTGYFMDLAKEAARFAGQGEDEPAEAVLDFLKHILVKENLHYRNPQYLTQFLSLEGKMAEIIQKYGEDSPAYKALVRSAVSLRVHEEVRGSIERYRYLDERGWNRSRAAEMHERIGARWKKEFLSISQDLNQIHLIGLANSFPQEFRNLKDAVFFRFFLSEFYLERAGVVAEWFRKALEWEISAGRVGFHYAEGRKQYYRISPEAFYFIFDPDLLTGEIPLFLQALADLSVMWSTSLRRDGENGAARAVEFFIGQMKAADTVRKIEAGHLIDIEPSFVYLRGRLQNRIGVHFDQLKEFMDEIQSAGPSAGFLLDFLKAYLAGQSYTGLYQNEHLAAYRESVKNAVYYTDRVEPSRQVDAGQLELTAEWLDKRSKQRQRRLARMPRALEAAKIHVAQTVEARAQGLRLFRKVLQRDGYTSEKLKEEAGKIKSDNLRRWVLAQGAWMNEERIKPRIVVDELRRSRDDRIYGNVYPVDAASLQFQWVLYDLMQHILPSTKSAHSIENIPPDTLSFLEKPAYYNPLPTPNITPISIASPSGARLSAGQPRLVDATYDDLSREGYHLIPNEARIGDIRWIRPILTKNGFKHKADIEFQVSDRHKIVFAGRFYPNFQIPQTDSEKIGRGRALFRKISKEYRLAGYEVWSDANHSGQEMISKMEEFNPLTLESNFTEFKKVQSERILSLPEGSVERGWVGMAKARFMVPEDPASHRGARLTHDLRSRSALAVNLGDLSIVRKGLIGYEDPFGKAEMFLSELGDTPFGNVYFYGRGLYPVSESSSLVHRVGQPELENDPRVHKRSINGEDHYFLYIEDPKGAGRTVIHVYNYATKRQMVGPDVWNDQGNSFSILGMDQLDPRTSALATKAKLLGLDPWFDFIPWLAPESLTAENYKWARYYREWSQWPGLNEQFRQHYPAQRDAAGRRWSEWLEDRLMENPGYCAKIFGEPGQESVVLLGHLGGMGGSNVDQIDLDAENPDVIRYWEASAQRLRQAGAEGIRVDLGENLVGRNETIRKIVQSFRGAGSEAGHVFTEGYGASRRPLAEQGSDGVYFSNLFETYLYYSQNPNASAEAFHQPLMDAIREGSAALIYPSNFDQSRLAALGGPVESYVLLTSLAAHLAGGFLMVDMADLLGWNGHYSPIAGGTGPVQDGHAHPFDSKMEFLGQPKAMAQALNASGFSGLLTEFFNRLGEPPQDRSQVRLFNTDNNSRYLSVAWPAADGSWKVSVFDFKPDQPARPVRIYFSNEAAQATGLTETVVNWSNAPYGLFTFASAGARLTAEADAVPSIRAKALIDTAKKARTDVEVLTVCWMNQHRSPAMHAILEDTLEREGMGQANRVKIRSGGMWWPDMISLLTKYAGSAGALPAAAPVEAMIQAAVSNGIDEDLVRAIHPAGVTAEAVQKASLIVVSDRWMLGLLLRYFPEAKEKAFLFSDLAPGIFDTEDMPDPGQDQISYAELFAGIRRGFEAFLLPLLKRREQADFWPVTVDISDESVRKASEIAIKLARYVQREKFNALVFSGSSRVTGYEPFAAAWNKLYPGEAMPKIVLFDRRDNKFLYKDSNISQEKKRTIFKSKLMDTPGNAKILAVEDISHSGTKVRDMAAAYQGAGYTNVRWAHFAVSPESAVLSDPKRSPFIGTTDPGFFSDWALLAVGASEGASGVQETLDRVTYEIKNSKQAIRNAQEIVRRAKRAGLDPAQELVRSWGVSPSWIKPGSRLDIRPVSMAGWFAGHGKGNRRTDAAVRIWMKTGIFPENLRLYFVGIENTDEIEPYVLHQEAHDAFFTSLTDVQRSVFIEIARELAADVASRPDSYYKKEEMRPEMTQLLRKLQSGEKDFDLEDWLALSELFALVVGEHLGYSIGPSTRFESERFASWLDSVGIRRLDRSNSSGARLSESRILDVVRKARLEGLDQGKAAAAYLGIPAARIRSGMAIELPGDRRNMSFNWSEKRTEAVNRTKRGVGAMLSSGTFPDTDRVYFIQVPDDYSDGGIDMYAAHEILHDYFLVSLSRDEQKRFAALILDAAKRHEESSIHIYFKRHVAPPHIARLNASTPEKIVADPDLLIDASEVFSIVAGAFIGLVPEPSRYALHEFERFLSELGFAEDSAYGARLAEAEDETERNWTPETISEAFSQLVNHPEWWDWEKVKTSELVFLKGAELPLDRRGHFNFHPFPEKQYSVPILGFGEEGWTARVVSAGMRRGNYEFRVLLKKGKQTLPVKVFQVGPLTKKLHTKYEATVRPSGETPDGVLSIDDRPGLAVLAELQRKPADFDWDANAFELPRFKRLLIGRSSATDSSYTLRPFPGEDKKQYKFQFHGHAGQIGYLVDGAVQDGEYRFFVEFESQTPDAIQVTRYPVSIGSKRHRTMDLFVLKRMGPPEKGVINKKLIRELSGKKVSFGWNGVGFVNGRFPHQAGHVVVVVPGYGLIEIPENEIKGILPFGKIETSPPASTRGARLAQSASQPNVWKAIYEKAPGKDFNSILPGQEVSVAARRLVEEVRLPKPASILTLGAWRGGDELYFAENGYDVTATDFIQEPLNDLMKTAQERGFGARMKVQQQDLTQPLQFEPGSFDVVFSNLSLHFLNDETLRARLREIKTILKNNSSSKVVVTVRSLLDRKYVDAVERDGEFSVAENGKRLRFFSEESLRAIFEEEGFTGVTVRAIPPYERYVGDGPMHTLELTASPGLSLEAGEATKREILAAREDFEKVLSGSWRFLWDLADDPSEYLFKGKDRVKVHLHAYSGSSIFGISADLEADGPGFVDSIEIERGNFAKGYGFVPLSQLGVDLNSEAVQGFALELQILIQSKRALQDAAKQGKVNGVISYALNPGETLSRLEESLVFDGQFYDHHILPELVFYGSTENFDREQKLKEYLESQKTGGARLAKIESAAKSFWMPTHPAKDVPILSEQDVHQLFLTHQTLLWSYGTRLSDEALGFLDGMPEYEFDALADSQPFVFDGNRFTFNTPARFSSSSSLWNKYWADTYGRWIQDRLIQFYNDVVIDPQYGYVIPSRFDFSMKGVMRDIQDKRINLQGASVEDLGTGPGFAAIASSLLGASRVVAVDRSENALEISKRHASRHNIQLDWRNEYLFEAGSMESSFDYVFSRYVMHMVPPFVRSDVLSRAARDLRPGGTFIAWELMDTQDWSLDDWRISLNRSGLQNFSYQASYGDDEEVFFSAVKSGARLAEQSESTDKELSADEVEFLRRRTEADDLVRPYFRRLPEPDVLETLESLSHDGAEIFEVIAANASISLRHKEPIFSDAAENLLRRLAGQKSRVIASLTRRPTTAYESVVRKIIGLNIAAEPKQEPGKKAHFYNIYGSEDSFQTVGEYDLERIRGLARAMVLNDPAQKWAQMAAFLKESYRRIKGEARASARPWIHELLTEVESRIPEDEKVGPDSAVLAPGQELYRILAAVRDALNENRPQDALNLISDAEQQIKRGERSYKYAKQLFWNFLLLRQLFAERGMQQDASESLARARALVDDGLLANTAGITSALLQAYQEEVAGWVESQGQVVEALDPAARALRHAQEMWNRQIHAITVGEYDPQLAGYHRVVHLALKKNRLDLAEDLLRQYQILLSQQAVIRDVPRNRRFIISTLTIFSHAYFKLQRYEEAEQKAREAMVHFNSHYALSSPKEAGYVLSPFTNLIRRYLDINQFNQSRALLAEIKPFVIDHSDGLAQTGQKPFIAEMFRRLMDYASVKGMPVIAAELYEEAQALNLDVPHPANGARLTEAIKPMIFKEEGQYHFSHAERIALERSLTYTLSQQLGSDSISLSFNHLGSRTPVQLSFRQGESLLARSKEFREALGVYFGNGMTFKADWDVVVTRPEPSHMVIQLNETFGARLTEERSSGVSSSPKEHDYARLLEEGYTFSEKWESSVNGHRDLIVSIFQRGVEIPVQIRIAVNDASRTIFITQFFPAFPMPSSDEEKVGRGRALLRHLIHRQEFEGYIVLAKASDELQKSFYKMTDFQPLTVLHTQDQLKALKDYKLKTTKFDPGSTDWEWWNATRLHGIVPPTSGARLAEQKIIWPENELNPDRNKLGEKAYKLILMSRDGIFRIPRFFVIRSNGTGKLDLNHELRSAFEAVKKPVLVRSAHPDEGRLFSFSGQLSSFDNVSEWIEPMYPEEEAWMHDPNRPVSIDAAYSRMIANTSGHFLQTYLTENGITDFDPLKMNAVVMEQINPEYFAMFLTSSQSNPDEILIHYEKKDTPEADGSQVWDPDLGGIATYSRRTGTLKDPSNKLSVHARAVLEKFGRTAALVHEKFGLQQIEIASSRDDGEVYLFQSRDIHLKGVSDVPRFAHYRNLEATSMSSEGVGQYRLPIIVVDRPDWAGSMGYLEARDALAENLRKQARDFGDYILVLKTPDILLRKNLSETVRDYSVLNELVSGAKVVLRNKNQSALGVKHEQWANVDKGHVNILLPDGGVFNQFASRAGSQWRDFSFADEGKNTGLITKQYWNVQLQTGDWLNVISNADGAFIWYDKDSAGSGARLAEQKTFSKYEDVLMEVARVNRSRISKESLFFPVAFSINHPMPIYGARLAGTPGGGVAMYLHTFNAAQIARFSGDTASLKPVRQTNWTRDQILRQRTQSLGEGLGLPGDALTLPRGTVSGSFAESFPGDLFTAVAGIEAHDHAALYVDVEGIWKDGRLAPRKELDRILQILNLSLAYRGRTSDNLKLVFYGSVSQETELKIAEALKRVSSKRQLVFVNTTDMVLGEGGLPIALASHLKNQNISITQSVGLVYSQHWESSLGTPQKMAYVKTDNTSLSSILVALTLGADGKVENLPKPLRNLIGSEIWVAGRKVFVLLPPADFIDWELFLDGLSRRTVQTSA